MTRVIWLCCGLWLTASALARGQGPAGPGELPPPGLPPHHEARELTAEDVPDEEPRCPRRWWVRSEYVMWLMKKAETPPLLTTSLNTQPGPGIIGVGNTRTIYGGDIDLRERHGGLFTLGHAFDDEGIFTVEAIYGFVGDRTVGIFTGSPGSSPAFPVLARPFFNTQTNQEDASLVTFPGLAAGSVDIKYGNYFDTGELNASYRMFGCEEKWLDLLGGIRVCRLEESLVIRENVTVDPKSPRFAGNNIQVRDLFDTDNTFYGGQLGLRGVLRRKRWHLEATAKVALGAVDQDLTVQGDTVINSNPAFLQQAGLLALATNRGAFSSTGFCVIPEVNLNLGYRITEVLQVHFGYSFLYLSEVFRPGDQIDRRLNPNLIPTSATFGQAGGPPLPAPLQSSSDFWMHGFRFGLELRF